MTTSDTRTTPLEPGDRVRINTPSQPHHGREGTITHAAPISTVTLDGDHGDLRLFERHELIQLSEDGYDGIQHAIDAAEAWMDAYASHHTQPGAPEAGDPPVTALAVLIAVLRDSQRALGWPDDGERLAGWNVYKHRDDTEPSYWLGPESVFSPAFEADDDAAQVEDGSESMRGRYALSDTPLADFLDDAPAEDGPRTQ